MPTRPADRELDVLVADWRYPRQALHQEPIKSWRAERGNPELEHRQVTVLETAPTWRLARFNVSVDPNSRELFVHSVEFFPGPDPAAADFRLPFAAYLRVARHAIAYGHDDDHLTYAFRGGKIFAAAFGTPIETLPPRRRSHRAHADLDHVAAIYNNAPKAPTRAVQRAYGFSWRTAARRVQEARDVGKIPPLTETRTRGDLSRQE